MEISEEGSGDRTEGRQRRIKGEIIGRRGGEGRRRRIKGEIIGRRGGEGRRRRIKGEIIGRRGGEGRGDGEELKGRS